MGKNGRMNAQPAQHGADAEGVKQADPDSGNTVDDAESAQEATKRRFREALAAKHSRPGEDHVDPNPPQPEPHGPMNDKRVFRRKTG